MFKRARLQLTAWYLLILIVVSLFFSVAIYGLVSQEIDRFAARGSMRRPNHEIDIDFVVESKHHLLVQLFYQNILILVLSGSLSYFLAGKTLKPISEAVEEQKMFVSDASHELKTPLTALKSTFEVTLRDKNLSLSDAVHTLNLGIIEVDKLTNLTNSMLRLSRLESGNSLQHVTINLQDIVSGVISRLSAKASIKKIVILNKVKNVSIVGDPASIEELLEIIVDNAIKYSQAKPITISSKTSSHNQTLVVKDQGVGISNQDLPHIFDRFYRADNARSKDGENSYGLGLPIAKKIVDKHNAKIIVDSDLGVGTTVQLVFRL